MTYTLGLGRQIAYHQQVPGDRVIRAMTNDGAFRAICAITSQTASDAASTQGATGAEALQLAELITGAVIIRETTAPGRRVQLVARKPSGSTLVADSLPGGITRGIVRSADAEEATRVSGHAGVLQVNYTLPTGALHQGLIALEDAPISEVLMHYMQKSEQTVCVVVVEAIERNDGSRVSGGYLVQLLPEASRDVLKQMTDRLQEIQTIRTHLQTETPSPDLLLNDIFAGFKHTLLADSALQFGCTCTEERILTGLLTLPPPEINSMIDENQPLEIRCDACGRQYVIHIPLLSERFAKLGGKRFS